MGTYYKNQIQITKNKEEEINGEEFNQIKNSILSVMENLFFDYTINDVSEIMDYNVILECEDRTYVFNSEFYTKLDMTTVNDNHCGYVYIEFNSKGVNMSYCELELVKKLKRNYKVKVITYESGGGLHPPHLSSIYKDLFIKERIIGEFKEILVDIVKSDDTTDNLIQKIISTNDRDIIKSSVRNKNISDETLDIIFSKGDNE